MPISMEQVKTCLGPHFDRLYRCSVGWFDRYQESYPDRPVHDPRTRASIAHDLMVDAARREFDGVGGARFIEIRGKHLTLLDIDEKVIILFKKLDTNRTPRCYPTENSKQLLNGTPDLPEIPPAATLVVVGYVLTYSQTAIKRVSIIKPKGSGARPEWYFDLELSVPSAPASSAPASPATSEKPEIPARRIRPKPGAIQSAFMGEDDDFRSSNDDSRTGIAGVKTKRTS